VTEGGERTPSPPVRVRFAPSPTGNLHLGGARTALFNWLYARRHGGTFVLRIEDTDRERSRPEFTREIIESLTWLGLCLDEGPHFQSHRLDRYREAAERLTAAGEAYPCFCTPAELQERRSQAEEGGGSFLYDGRCRDLGSGDVQARLRGGERPALRLAVPPGSVAWDDLVRGQITFQNDQYDDFVILKSDGMPTYHFAAVVDDADMEISHIIRGDDHITNTPRQLFLYRALEARPPRFAHIPLIHGRDGGRLSKRHGATAVLEYRRMGYLPEALVNYLALLGWSPGEDREILPLAEMVERFDLSRVVKTPAVFDPEKLTWMNSRYLATLSVGHRTNLLLPLLQEAGLFTPWDETGRRAWLEDLVSAVGDRLKTLADFIPYTRFLFVEGVTPDAAAAAVLAKAVPDRPRLAAVVASLSSLTEWRRDEIEKAIREAMAREGLSSSRGIAPLRAAVSGTTVTPGLFESLELLGRERSLRRLGPFLTSDPAPRA
jgi:glutamyl-tRNA synthetase